MGDYLTTAQYNIILNLQPVGTAPTQIQKYILVDPPINAYAKIILFNTP